MRGRGGRVTLVEGRAAVHAWSLVGGVSEAVVKARSLESARDVRGGVDGVPRLRYGTRVGRSSGSGVGVIGIVTGTHMVSGDGESTRHCCQSYVPMSQPLQCGVASPEAILTDVVDVFAVARGVGSVSACSEAKVVGRHERGPLVGLFQAAGEGVGEDQSALRVSEPGPSCWVGWERWVARWVRRR